MDPSAARRVGVLAGQLQPLPTPQLARAPCAGGAPQRSSMFAGQVILITGAGKVRAGSVPFATARASSRRQGGCTAGRPRARGLRAC